jgi:hypothetical protein
MRLCPECGVPVSPRSCDDLFQELLALDHSRQAPWGPLHGIAVACFFLQHSSHRAGAARALYWGMLHAYLRGGRAPQAGDYPGAPPFPDAEPPRSYATTIADVAVDGSFPAAGHKDRVRSWAADTTSAWQAQRLRPGRLK